MPELRPPDVPPGWEIGPPSFVGVGAAGAGTTWWHGLIEAHPDVVRAPGVPESLHYFDEFWNGGFDEADADRYRGFFPRPPGRLTGEWSATYSADFWTPRLLQRAAPHARLLMLVRDPVERFRAGLVRRADADGLEWTPRAAANAAFQRGLYADQVLRIRAAFPAEQLLILQYERCRSSPREELARTFEFLGLDPAPATGTDADVGEAGAADANAENGETGDESSGGDGGEAANASHDLTDPQRIDLARRYAAENRRLAELAPDLDLSLWTSAEEDA